MDGNESGSPSLRTRVLWYGVTVLVALAFPAIGYRLDSVNFHAPISHETDALMSNDTLLILPMVQATHEGGTHWWSERLGFPGVQELYDFPVIDHLHFAGIWLLGQFTGSAVITFNLYYLLGYPLAALAMLMTLRQLGATLPAAAAMGVLFAALPFHQYRSQNHFFLSAYFMVPLTCLVMIWICTGRLPFFPRTSENNRRWSLRDRPTICAVVIVLLTSMAGAYYAFFACALLFGAGLYGWIAAGTGRAIVSACLLIALIVAAGMIQHLPTYLHHAQYGPHTGPVVRPAEEADMYALKIAQLILPIDDHRLRPLAEFKSIFNCNPMRMGQVYTERYSLGLIGAIGFIGLMVRLLLPIPRRQPLAAVAFLSGICVILGVSGGLGAIFNQAITPSVRCYNRIAIYIAAFSLIAVALGGDRLVERLRLKIPSRFPPAAVWLTVLVFGLWDQTPIEWASHKRIEKISVNQMAWAVDHQFFRDIERALNPETERPGPAVYQLPYVMWPESPAIFQLPPYDHVRGYLHSQSLRWSFGCMKGREVDEWQRSVNLLAPNAMEKLLDRVVLAGFSGLFLDKRGYSPGQAALVEQELLKKLPGAIPIRHPDGQQVFFDLRRHREDIRQGRDWAAESFRETHRPCILWLNGFLSQREPGYEWMKRLGGPDCTAIFVNPTTESRTFNCTFRLYTEMKDPATLTIDGGDIWTETLSINQDSPVIARTFTVPPGRHTIRFRCEAPPSFMASEHRRLVFLVSGLKFD